MNKFIKILTRPAKSVTNLFKFYGGISALIINSVKNYFMDNKGKKRINRVLLMQIFFTGNSAFFTISLVSLALGAITVMQLFTQLGKLGALGFVGKILNVVIVQEMGPLITGFIVLSRSGSAISAEIGTMMVNDEINAMEMLGIDTLKFVVFPRIAGMVISVTLLTIYFDAIGIIGGFLTGGLYAGVTFGQFIEYVVSAITFSGFLISIVKSLFFGVFISSISIFYGFQAFVSTRIPVMTTKAIANSIFALFIIDVIFSLINYL